MRNETDELLLAHVLRSYPADTPLPGEAVANAVTQVQPHELKDRLAARLQSLRRRGVVNLHTLAGFGLRPWVFLASGRTGQFDQILRARAARQDGISHYVLYGEWDALLLLYGSQQEADDLYERLAASAYDSPPVRLSVDRVVLSERLSPTVLPDDIRLSADEIESLNALVADFDDPALVAKRHQFLESHHLLGAVWDARSISAQESYAFVGLTLRGRTSASPESLLTALTNTDAIDRCLTDVYQVSPSVPFSYLLRLSFDFLPTLDSATDALSLLRIRDMSIKCTTLVVASFNQEYPLLRQPQIDDLPFGPATNDLVRVTESVFHALPPLEQRRFNDLSGEDQLQFAGQYHELRRALADMVTDAQTVSRFESAIGGFASSVLTNPSQPNLTGPVSEMMVRVEELGRDLLASLIADVFGRDTILAQQELKLPTRRVSAMSFGKVVAAFRIASGLPKFRKHQDVLDDGWLDRLERLGRERNLWVHGGHVSSGHRLSEEATRALIESATVARWLVGATLSVRHQPDPADRGPDFFISHASEDKEDVARPLYRELMARGFSVWLDESELLVGDSLRSNIDNAIARARFGIIILSDNFFRKNWSQEELNGLFVRQMHGTKVLLPVWHQIDAATVARYSPMLADKLAGNSANGIAMVADQIEAVYRAETTER